MARNTHCRTLLLLGLAAGICAGHIARGEEIVFSRDVMAVLSKAGCNAGTCHGNANGKGGFKLSLRGEDVAADFLTLTRDQFARRLDTLAPESSLALLKATAQVAHEGGRRFGTNSPEYGILREWIAGGATASTNRVHVARLAVTPLTDILIEPRKEVALRVTATFATGEQRDVTGLAVYEPANRLIQVDHDGRATATGFGEGTVLVRYLDAQVPVQLAFVPARPDFKWSRPKENNYVDREVFAKLRSLRMNPSGVTSDEVFIRRACLDLLGLPPTAGEARAFVADRRKDKRSRLIDSLLERPEFTDFWALKWSDLLRNEEHALDTKGVQVFNDWIRQGIAAHKPMDQFVRELLTASGSTYNNPAANFYRANRAPIIRGEAVAQVFLGTRLQCAKCHNHPFDRWTQDDYYNWAGVFARIGYKVLDNNRIVSTDKHEWKGEQVVFVTRTGSVTNPRTGKDSPPQFLGETQPLKGGDAGEAEDELARVAAWITNPANTMFARTQVNRIWYHLMGRGLVEPVDDFRATNPASHPALLEQLARDFVKQGYDLRHVIRVIMNSQTYQLSIEPNATNGDDDLNYSHTLARRLTAEQVLDSGSRATDVPLKFDHYPAGMRAAQLPGVAPRARGGRRSNANEFLDVFGKPPRLLVTECERSCEPTMGQAFQMISGPLLNEMIAHKNNRLAALLAGPQTDAEVVEELYWAVLTRAPGTAERDNAMKYVASATDRRAGFEDVLWSLVNAKEFVFRQ